MAVPSQHVCEHELDRAQPDHATDGADSAQWTTSWQTGAHLAPSGGHASQHIQEQRLLEAPPSLHHTCDYQSSAPGHRACAVSAQQQQPVWLAMLDIPSSSLLSGSGCLHKLLYHQPISFHCSTLFVLGMPKHLRQVGSGFELLSFANIESVRTVLCGNIGLSSLAGWPCRCKALPSTIKLCMVQTPLTWLLADTEHHAQ